MQLNFPIIKLTVIIIICNNLRIKKIEVYNKLIIPIEKYQNNQSVKQLMSPLFFFSF